jgi:hypothetical protein
VTSSSQSAQIKDEITVDTAANAPMSSESKKRMSSAVVEAASAAIARAQHFIKDRANVGKDRTTWHEKTQITNFLRGHREPEIKVKDTITLGKQAPMPSDPSTDLPIDDSVDSKEVELKKEEDRPPSSSTLRMASITSDSTENIFQKVSWNLCLAHAAKFGEPKQSELFMTVDKDQESREDDDIDEKLPSLSSEYLGISLSNDSSESPEEEEQGADEQIPIIDASFTTNDECRSSGVFAKVMKMMDMKGYVSTTCQRPHFTMPKMSNQWNNMQDYCTCLDPIRESCFKDNAR